MTRKLAAQLGITDLGAVVESVKEHTGNDISSDTAYRLCIWILDKRNTPPDAPQRYVTAAIGLSPHEIQQHLYETEVA